MQIGIDNYGLFPIDPDPIETLQWAVKHGADGVAFSGLDKRVRDKIDKEYLKDLKQYADTNNLYLEWGGGLHIPRDMNSWNKKDIFANNQQMAEEAEILETQIIRSCSGGLMRWNPKNPPTETLLAEMANTLKQQKQMLKDHNVILAVETHFEFTTFELLKVFELCEAEPGDYLGICLDTMNLLTMLEDPVMATERILPWVVSTHIKDGGILLTEKGLTTFTTEIGKGIVDFEEIIRLFSKLDKTINLSVEDHGGNFFLPIFNPEFTSKFPDLSINEFLSLLKMAQNTKEKVDKGECSILEREKWPKICEERMRSNILRLKKINNRIE